MKEMYGIFLQEKNQPEASLNVGVILTIPGSGSEMSEFHNK